MIYNKTIRKNKNHANTKKEMGTMRKLNELLDMRNELVSEADHIEIYDIMDAADTEEQAIDGLAQEIHQLLNVWMKIDPTEAARYRKDLMRIIND